MFLQDKLIFLFNLIVSETNYDHTFFGKKNKNYVKTVTAIDNTTNTAMATLVSFIYPFPPKYTG
jgi:hypothetical protein